MRLFVGVGVGDGVRATASRVRSAFETSFQQIKGLPPRVVWVAPQALHLTVRFLGEVPDADVPGIVEAVQEPYTLAPFSVTWHGLGAFPSAARPRVLWIGVGAGARELGALEREVARRLGGLAPGEDAEPATAFHPHLTIARVKVDARGVDWPALMASVPVEDVRSSVSHVTLVRSRGLPGGAGYEEVGRGRLAG
jgi:2'-5' RNA ligase